MTSNKDTVELSAIDGATSTEEGTKKSFAETLKHSDLWKHRGSMTLSNEIFIPEVVARINKGKNVTIPLRGYSMRPFLEDRRDSAVLVKVKHPLEIGDVVLGQLPDGRYALHRIISIADGKIQMLGDGNLTPDPVITEDKVLASAYSFYRKGRTVPDLVEGRKFKIYSWCWMKLRPLRRYLLYIYRKTLKIW